MSGKFITVEGPDGAGKSTGLVWLFDYLKDFGVDCIRTREPGGTPLAERLREFLLTPTDELMCPLTEVMVVGAARAQHIDQVIKPHMAKGTHVLCDRFADSTYAYQGSGRGLFEEVEKVEKLVLAGFEPDVTLYFDAPLEIRMQRLGARPGKSDRLDNEALDFFKRVQEGYETRFNENPHRMYRIDASGDVHSVLLQLQKWADTYFNLKPPKP